ncbi:MAG: DUF2183 domain-containing protein, partial [Saprospiraceae bacterium]|nr:DUF2183 domain-containing protein [Saprospiraceae bacterium]
MINIFRKQDKVIIQPYRGYSSPQRLYLTGRILEDEQINSHREESFFQTLRNNYKIWESDEVAHVPVTLEIADQIHQTITDREGFFMFDEAEGIDSGEREHWLKVLLKANFTYRRRQYQIANPAEVFLPDRAAQFGIISDIDDTVLHTDVLSRLRMLRNTFFYNPYRRKPLPGMSTWIRGLRNGADGEQKNPVFYVSKSPRNIFNYLATFLQINDFPKGPILLRDFGRTGLR